MAGFSLISGCAVAIAMALGTFMLAQESSALARAKTEAAAKVASGASAVYAKDAQWLMDTFGIVPATPEQDTDGLFYAVAANGEYLVHPRFNGAWRPSISVLDAVAHNLLLPANETYRQRMLRLFIIRVGAVSGVDAEYTLNFLRYLKPMEQSE